MFNPYRGQWAVFNGTSEPEIHTTYASARLGAENINSWVARIEEQQEAVRVL